MKCFVILLILVGFLGTVFAPSYAQLDEFGFVNLSDSYLLGEEFSIVFKKMTHQPCPSYDVILMKEGIPESKITYGTEPLCAISGLVEPYIFSGTFEKSEFFNSIGTYSIRVMLDDETIDKKIKIINPEYYSSFLSPLKQIKAGIDQHQIKCKPDFYLVYKYNGSPACVLPESVPKLIQRNWMEIENVTSESSRLCHSIPETGLCKAAIEKYYFDSESNSCKSFTWGGCGGKVPFDTIELCQGLCGIENEK